MTGYDQVANESMSRLGSTKINYQIQMTVLSNTKGQEKGIKGITEVFDDNGHSAVSFLFI